MLPGMTSRRCLLALGAALTLSVGLAQVTPAQDTADTDAAQDASHTPADHPAGACGDRHRDPQRAGGAGIHAR